MQNVLEMILAGTDTSSVSMFFFLLACRDDPCLQLRLAQEVEGLGVHTDSTLVMLKVSRPEDRLPMKMT